MAHVLIGFAEALPAPEVVFSLRQAGHRVSAFTRDKDTTLRHLRLEALHVLPAPEENADAAQMELRDLLSDPDIADVVLPLDDAGLWLCDAVLGDDPRNAGATERQAMIALDKIVQTEMARAAGFAVPKTRIVRSSADLTDDLQMPSIAKPAMALHVRNGQLDKGTAHYLIKASDMAALRDALSPDAAPLLVQPLVAGEGLGVFGYAGADGVVAWSGHKRLRMMNPHGSGSSACQSMMPDEDIRRKISDFLQAANWRGPFMIELLRDADGTDWFMELNGRMWGSMALARRQGLEYPAWAVAQAMASDFSPSVPDLSEQPTTVRHLGRELVHLLFVLRGPKSSFHRSNWPRFMTSLFGVLSPATRRSFYNFDPANPGYFWRDAWATVMRQLRR